MSLVKKLLFFIALLILLVIAAAVLAAFNAQKIASALQPQIESLASKSLGTKVRLGELKLSLFPQIEIVAPEVHIGDANEVEGFSLQEGSLTLDWFPLLYGKAVAQVALVKPRLTVEKGGDGIVIPGLPLGRKQGQTSVEPETEKNPQLSDSTTSQKESSPLALDIRSITVSDGNVNLVGLLPTTSNAPVEISGLEVVTALRLEGKKAILDGFRTDFSARGIGDFQLTGSTVEVDLSTSDASWQDLWIQGPGIKLTANGTASPRAYEVKISKSSLNLSELALLGKTIAPLAAVGNYKPTGELMLDLTVAGTLTPLFSPPLLAGQIELQNISSTIPDRELKNIKGSLVLGHAKQNQHVSTQKISLNFVDNAQLSKPLPITVAIQDIDITPELSIKVPGWTIETPGTVFSGDASANLGGTGKTSTEISLNNRSSIDLKGLKAYLKALAPLEIEGTVSPAGKAHIDIGTASIRGTGSAGLKSINYVQTPYTFSDLSADYSLEFNSNGANATSNDLKLKVNDVPLEIKAVLKAANRYTTFSIDNLVAKGFDGELKGHLLYASPSSFTVKVESQSLALPPLIKLAGLSWLPDTSGSLGPLNLGIQGQLGTGLLKSLHGRVSLEARDTVFKGFNLAGAVLGKIDEISLISGGLTKGAPELLQDYTSRKDTIIKEIMLNGAITQGTLNLGVMRLLSDVFEVEGRGEIELPTNRLDMGTTFSFNKDFTQRLVASVKEIERISAADGRLSFPLKISGIPPKLLVVPDFGELLKLGAKKALKDQAGKLIDKALGGGGEGKGPGGAGKEVLDKLLAW
jgi:hypothetical protein